MGQNVRCIQDSEDVRRYPRADRDTWNRAQAVKTANLVRGDGNTKTFYLLQHLIKCQGCGRLLGARTRRDRNKINRYYRCYGYQKSCRTSPHINADALEARVWSEISDVLKRPDLLSARFNASEDAGALAEDITSAERDVTKWNRKNERLVSLYVGEDITKAEFDHQRKYIQEPLEAAQQRLSGLRDRQGRADASMGILGRFLAVSREYMDDEEKRKVLHNVIESATLSAENQPRYQLRLPAAPKIYASSAEAERDGLNVGPEVAIGNTPSAWT